jgi:hypothetical protein
MYQRIVSAHLIQLVDTLNSSCVAHVFHGLLHTRTAELDRIVKACLGAQGVPLHNQFIICLWQNAQCTQVPCSLETVAQLQPSLRVRCTRVKPGEALTLDSSYQRHHVASADAAGMLQAIYVASYIRMCIECLCTCVNAASPIIV